MNIFFLIILLFGYYEEEMKTQDFLNLLNLEGNKWVLNKNLNGGYPILSWQAEKD